LDKVPRAEVAACEDALLQFFHERKQDLCQRITDTGDLDEQAVEQLDTALAEFRKSYTSQQSADTEATATV
jgi:F0F1-type ATP synthase alpha subunit